VSLWVLSQCSETNTSRRPSGSALAYQSSRWIIHVEDWSHTLLTTIIGARLPIVVVLLLGFFSGWHRDFNGDQATTLNRMGMLQALPLVLSVAGGMIGSFFIVLLAARFVFLRDLGTSALQALTIGGPAVPFVGVSVLGYVFGPAVGESNHNRDEN
jgi:hypothetical protein